MSLPSPQLDDRDFQTLLDEARARIEAQCPEWTDLGPSDPGMALVEVFAHLTELTLFRLNRVPEKVHRRLLDLVGLHLTGATAARAVLRFRRKDPESADVLEIPLGTRVSAGARGPSFVTVVPAQLTNESSVDVVARHAEAAVLRLGEGNGHPGQRFSFEAEDALAWDRELPVVVGVERQEGDAEHTGVNRRRHGELVFDEHYEVRSFGGGLANVPGFVFERSSGQIVFPPDRAGPPRGREVRVWYWVGGGTAGNVGPDTLDTLTPKRPEFQVSNPRAARGGRAKEDLPSALRRAPLALAALDRAVTASDIEGLACAASREVNRALAITLAEQWRHAAPGTVEVVLVPNLPRQTSPGAITREAVMAAQNAHARTVVTEALEARRPLGSQLSVRWARYVTVTVQATVSPTPSASRRALKTALLRRLHGLVQPLQTPEGPAWPFGAPLRAADVWRVLLPEPGVDFVEAVSFEVDPCPRSVTSLAADPAQADTWFAGGRDGLFRTVDGGASWERLRPSPEGGKVSCLERSGARAGTLAMALEPADRSQSELLVSEDAGETWRTRAVLPRINDLAWVDLASGAVLLAATDEGLFRLDPDGLSSKVIVDGRADYVNDGVYAVTTATHARGEIRVAVSTKRRGVYLSTDARLQGFKEIGLDGEQVEALEMMQDGPRIFLYAGLAAVDAARKGEGCKMREVTSERVEADQWDPAPGTAGPGWRGGSVEGFAVLERNGRREVVAATSSAGVLTLANGTWSGKDLGSGLPLNKEDRLFRRIDALAIGHGQVFVAVDGEIYARSLTETDEGPPPFRNISLPRREVVHLPPGALFCSGDHEILWKSE